MFNNPARRVIAAFFARIQNNSTWRIVKFCFDFLYDLHVPFASLIDGCSTDLQKWSYKVNPSRCQTNFICSSIHEVLIAPFLCSNNNDLLFY